MREVLLEDLENEEMEEAEEKEEEDEEEARSLPRDRGILSKAMSVYVTHIFFGCARPGKSINPIYDSVKGDSLAHRENEIKSTRRTFLCSKKQTKNNHSARDERSEF